MRPNMGNSTRPPAPEPLFPVADLEPRRCTHCGATNRADCDHDRSLEEGTISVLRRRPRSCIAGYDPATAPFPEGY